MVEKRVEKIFIIVFGIMGLFFLIGAFNLYLFLGIPFNNIVKTRAKVLEINPFNGVLVSYFINDDHFTNYLPRTKEDYYIGEDINIFYDKTNPKKITVPASYSVIYIFTGVGVLLFSIDLIIILVSYKKKKMILYLKNNASIINAKFVEVKLNKSYEVNGKNPFIIICEYKGIDGKVYTFKSENIWFNPTDIITKNTIKSFPIYVNHDNYKKYYMDIENVISKSKESI